MNPASTLAKRQHAPVAIARALEGRVDSAAAAYTELKTRYGAVVGEQVLNTVGYEMLRRQRVDNAIDIFQFMVREFPQSSNAYDSLGEGDPSSSTPRTPTPGKSCGAGGEIVSRSLQGHARE